MRNSLYKKIILAIAGLLVISGTLNTPAQAGLDEIINKDKPYRANLVDYQTEEAVPVTKSSSQVYMVQPGDTLWGLADRFGITPDMLAAANGLSAESQLYIGQVLDLPLTAVKHVVRAGETLSEICRRYQVTQAEVLNANNLQDPNLVCIGETLLIPLKYAAANERAVVAATAKLPAVAMDWPAEGSISSPFGIRGPQPHHGIDIAAPHGALIKSPCAGTVIHAGPYGTYGNAVIIDHGDGLQTLYAHCSTLLVKNGEYVQKGENIARVGSTGRSSGPHLHWEVRYRGVPFDPQLCIDMNYLAKR